MEPGSNVVLRMLETELIHQSSSAIRLLISPPINLLIIEKQQLMVKGLQEVGGGGDRGGDTCCLCTQWILVCVPVTGCAALGHMMQATVIVATVYLAHDVWQFHVCLHLHLHLPSQLWQVGRCCKISRWLFRGTSHPVALLLIRGVPKFQANNTD